MSDINKVGGSAEMASNPCLHCGACCARYRVSFYWGEADDAPGGYVPVGLTEQINPVMRAMRGTHPQPAGCVALEGTLGDRVHCGIYANRPTPCREFETHEPDGSVNPRCTAARKAIGLPALAPHMAAVPQP